MTPSRRRRSAGVLLKRRHSVIFSMAIILASISFTLMNLGQSTTTLLLDSAADAAVSHQGRPQTTNNNNNNSTAPRQPHYEMATVSPISSQAFVLDSRNNQDDINGAFVHVGKTAGSTLSLLLRNGCHSFLPKPCRTVPHPESIASKRIGSYYHVPDFHSLPSHPHSFYVISIRDPFDRTVSAFTYDHPLNAHDDRKDIPVSHLMGKLAVYRCFPSLETFVESIGDNVTDFVFDLAANQRIAPAVDCRNLARAAMNSKVRRFQHLFFNYGKILSLLPPGGLDSITLYVTRKEHLWDDWKAINTQLSFGQQKSTVVVDDTLLGISQQESTSGTGIAAAAAARNVSGRTLPVTRELSLAGRRRLCRALETEYQKYMLLLLSAENLSERDVQESLAYSRRNCPNLDYLLS